MLVLVADTARVTLEDTTDSEEEQLVKGVWKENILKVIIISTVYSKIENKIFPGLLKPVVVAYKI